MTITLDPIEIERVVSDEPSDSGCYREVWFFEDVVIKRDDRGGAVNKKEYDFYQNFTGGSFTHDGHEWTVKLPQTAMVGEYIVMSRINFPKLENMYDQRECNFCTIVNNFGYPTCANDCWGENLLRSLDSYMMNKWNIFDTHKGNFMYDIYTRTIWFVDFVS